jgi:hypothetical protein
MTEESSGNVFADIECEHPNALLELSAARIEWNSTLKEPLPDWATELLDQLK